MKKLFLILAAFCAVTALNAETRDGLLSKIAKAKEATQNEKKNTKPATWYSLGQAYYEGYAAVKGNIWQGAQQSEVKLLSSEMVDSKVVSTETVELSGTQYTVDHYADKDFYYSARGYEFAVVTKPLIDDDILALALDAFLKGASMDPKNPNKDVVATMTKIHDAYTSDAWAAYMLNDLAGSAVKFESAIPTFDNVVMAKKDSSSIYFAAALYNAAGNTAKAKELYNVCFAMGYDQEGNGHSAMAEILKAEGDVEGAKAVLNEGFAAFPTSQAILISLINLYMETKDDPNKILDLIHSAQKNEPANASLVYAEGNVYKQLGDIDKAVEFYNKSMEVDPSYVYGVYEVGNMYLNKAVDIQSAMDALDIKDVNGYNKLRDEFDECLMKCIPPFEKAFEAAKSDDIKKAIAQALKQVYFIFRNNGDEYKAGYEKYNSYLGE